MAKSFRQRTGPTGPRTAAGKAKANQNATKHRIFTVRMTTEEDETTLMFTDEIIKEFDMNGALECEVGRELARNRLEAQRINGYADQELQKAQMLADVNLEAMDARRTPLLRYPSPSPETPKTHLSRMRPTFCIFFLRFLKEQIEKSGPRPAENLGLLRCIYGDEKTVGGDAIINCYVVTKSNGTVGPLDTPNQAVILEYIDKEIASQTVRAQYDDVKDQLDFVPGLLALPVESLMDKIQKYRTANEREFGRLLGNLETIRRLKE